MRCIAKVCRNSGDSSISLHQSSNQGSYINTPGDATPSCRIPKHLPGVLTFVSPKPMPDLDPVSGVPSKLRIHISIEAPTRSWDSSNCEVCYIRTIQALLFTRIIRFPMFNIVTKMRPTGRYKSKTTPQALPAITVYKRSPPLDHQGRKARRVLFCVCCTRLCGGASWSESWYHPRP